MGKVRLEIPSSLVDVLNAENCEGVVTEGSDSIMLEKETAEWPTLGELLTDLALRHIDFRRMIFNPYTRKVTGQILITLNGTILPLPNVTELELKDGDNVALFPILYGG